MPVILDPATYDLWLDPGLHDAVAISQMLRPIDAQLIRLFPVSTRVNRVQNQDAEFAKQFELEPSPQGGLFNWHETDKIP